MKATRNSMKASNRLRRKLTPPEALLWKLLQGSPAGVKFRRQYAIGPYVADFYCPSAKLVIEIDGQIHNFEGRADRDVLRDEVIRGFGVRVERIAAGEVMRNATAVAQSIIELCLAGPGPSTAFGGPPPHSFGTGRSE